MYAQMRRREEEIVRKRNEQKRKQEQDGILKRQQEAESAAHAIRQTIAATHPTIIIPEFPLALPYPR